jgi:3-keto-5-aminohexanoate cleavage enzyme
MVSVSPARYREINALIREKCPDVIINNTTGGGPQMNREERMASIEAGPEICSLNMGPLASRGFLKKRLPPLGGRPEDIILDLVAPQTTFGETEMYVKAMAAKGIKPEMEVYNHGQWWLVHNLIDQSLVKPPYLIQFVMGFPSGALPTPKNLLHLVETAPMPSVISVIGIGLHQTAMVTMGILLGLNVRTGMEDNIFISRGQLCTGNTQLVEKVVRLARELGREIATPKQARQMLGLSETPSRYD